MFTEEDTELRDLLIQNALVPSGALSKIKAQVRASIFLALSDNEQLLPKQPLLNTKVRDQLQSTEGKILFRLVREFLEFFGLHFTLSVYEPESYLGTEYDYEGRTKLIEELGLTQNEENTEPLLLKILRLTQYNLGSQEFKHTEQTFKEQSYFSTVHSNDPSATEDLNKTYTTLSENIESMDTLSKSPNGYPKCVTEIKTVPKETVLSQTFEIVSPIPDRKNTPLSETENDFVQIPINLDQQSPDTVSKREIMKVETYEDTCLTAKTYFSDNIGKHSVVVPSVYQKSLASNDNQNKGAEHSLSVENEISPPVLKDSKLLKFETAMDKIKMPTKSEKAKTKNSLSSLAEFPPLQLNKSRGNDTMLLPSLYKKDKSSLRELDKLSEIDIISMDSYEEDFTPGTEISLSNSIYQNSDTSKVNVLASSRTNCGNTSISKVNGQKSKDVDIVTENSKHSLSNGVDLLRDFMEKKENCLNRSNLSTDVSHTIESTVNSDDLELNLNMDDTLLTSTSN